MHNSLNCQAKVTLKGFFCNAQSAHVLEPTYERKIWSPCMTLYFFTDTHIPPSLPPSLRPSLRPSVRVCVRAHVRTHIHCTYIHSYIHTHTCMRIHVHTFTYIKHWDAIMPPLPGLHCDRCKRKGREGGGQGGSEGRKKTVPVCIEQSDTHVKARTRPCAMVPCRLMISH